MNHKKTKATKQLSETAFGGILNIGKRKIQRSLTCIDDEFAGNCDTTLHVVLKAKDSNTLLCHSAEIEDYTRKLSLRFGIKILEIAVQPDHVHIMPVIPSTEVSLAETYTKWIRSLTGNLSRKFQIQWRLPPFTCVVESAEYLQSLRDYIRKNRRESEFILSAHRRVAAFGEILILCLRPGA